MDPYTAARKRWTSGQRRVLRRTRAAILIREVIQGPVDRFRVEEIGVCGRSRGDRVVDSPPTRQLAEVLRHRLFQDVFAVKLNEQGVLEQGIADGIV